MQPITNQAGDVRVFSCTAKHPCRSIHHTLQTIKSRVRQSSENAVTVVNPADYKALDLAVSNGSALMKHLILLSEAERKLNDESTQIPDRCHCRG